MQPLYHKYVELGYSVIPNRSDKPQVPALSSWSGYKEARATEQECDQWAHTYTNISMVMGQISNVVGLDIDDDALYSEIQDIPHQYLFAKKGSKGATLFFPYDEAYTKSKTWSAHGQSPACELLSNGRLTTIPPSKHPNGQNYYWLDGYNPIAGCRPNPYGLDTIIAFLDKKYPKPAKITTISNAYSQQNQDSEISLQEASAALAFIDPDCGYEQWVEIGMGLKSKFGEAGITLWNDWSLNGSKYKSEEIVPKWRSFKSDGITMGSVIHYAQQGGYQVPRQEKHGDIYEGITIGELEAPTPKPKEILIRGKKKAAAFPKELALSAPGAVGEIVHWIVGSSPYPQPVIALAGALALVGMLKGHRVRTKFTGYDTRTNIYTVGLLGSGQGKGAVVNCIRKLMNEAGSSNHLLGNPASGSGLYTSLYEAGGIGLAVIDEFGNTISGAIDPKAPAYQREIAILLTELFSVPHGIYLGKQYANKDGKKVRADIDQPCLCLFGATTHGQFLNNVRSSHFEDGLISRILLFDPGNEGLHARSVRPIYDMDAPPIRLVAQLRNMKRLDLAAHPVHGAITGPIIPSVNDGLITVAISDPAFELLSHAEESWRGKGNEYSKVGNHAHSAICLRVAEIATKLALIVCEPGVESRPGCIIEEDMAWAIQVAETCVEYVLFQLENYIAENPYQKEMNKILSFLRSNPDCTMTQLSKEARQMGIPVKRKDEVLRHAFEAGLIEYYKPEQPKGQGGRPAIIIRAI